MKKFYTFFAVVIVLNIIFLFLGIKPDEVKTTNAGDKPKLKVGLVFDVGGRGDKSFNDSAYNGLQRAIKNLVQNQTEYCCNNNRRIIHSQNFRQPTTSFISMVNR